VFAQQSLQPKLSRRRYASECVAVNVLQRWWSCRSGMSTMSRRWNKNVVSLTSSVIAAMATLLLFYCYFCSNIRVLIMF